MIDLQRYSCICFRHREISLAAIIFLKVQQCCIFKNVFIHPVGWKNHDKYEPDKQNLFLYYKARLRQNKCKKLKMVLTWLLVSISCCVCWWAALPSHQSETMAWLIIVKAIPNYSCFHNTSFSFLKWCYMHVFFSL